MRSPVTGIVALIVLFLVAIVGYSSLFTVQQTEQALVVRLGRPVDVVSQPGLNFKAPFIDSVIPVGFDAAAHHDPAGPGEHVEPVMDGDWAGWVHGGSDPADWQDTHHHAHPGFDHLA